MELSEQYALLLSTYDELRESSDETEDDQESSGFDFKKWIPVIVLIIVGVVVVKVVL